MQLTLFQPPWPCGYSLITAATPAVAPPACPAECLALLVLLPPSVPGQALRLVHVHHLDHEQHHKAEAGMEEVATP
jgi:hypothetical protein